MRGLLRWLHGLDQMLSQRLTCPRPSRWYWLPAFGAHLGDGALWLVLAAIFLIWGTDLIRGVTLITSIAVLAANAISTLVKYTVRRRRPQELNEFYALKYDRYSFPSGHATRMGAIAVILGHFFPFLAPAGYGLTVVVALCRVAVGVHYFSDVFAGLLIGMIGAKCILLML